MATTANAEIRVTDRSLQHEVSRQRIRRITPEAGQALQLLGHAIEYLTDEYVHETKKLSATDPQIAAIQLLMSLNRQVYYECPVAPTLGERLIAFFRGKRA